MRNWQGTVRPHWIEIVLAAALVLVGAAQVYIYIRQTEIMGTQAEIAKRQLDIYTRQAEIMSTQAKIAKRQLTEMQTEARAWVSIEPAIGNITWDKDGITIYLKYYIKNTGNSPAMHVETQDNVVPWVAPEGPLAALKRMTAEQRRVTFKSVVGVPLFPKDTRELLAIRKFSREDITKNFEYLSTFRHDPSEKPTLRAEDFKSVELTLLYFVDYTFGAGDAHHQHSCMSNIVRVDPKQTDRFRCLFASRREFVVTERPLDLCRIRLRGRLKSR
jgi:hypothetical protein